MRAPSTQAHQRPGSGAAAVPPHLVPPSPAAALQVWVAPAQLWVAPALTLQ